MALASTSLLLLSGRACGLVTKATLFDGRLTLTRGLYFFCSKAFFRIKLSRFFLEYQIIKLWTKRIKLNFLFKLSYLDWNFALTLGYVDPALHNPAQGVKGLISVLEPGCCSRSCCWFYLCRMNHWRPCSNIDLFINQTKYLFRST